MSSPRGQASAHGVQLHVGNLRPGSESIQFAPSDLFRDHTIPGHRDMEQKSRQTRAPRCASLVHT